VINFIGSLIYTRGKQQRGQTNTPQDLAFGRRVFETVLRFAPERILEVFLLETLKDYDSELSGVKVVRLRRAELDDLAQGLPHQGVIFRLKPLESWSLDAVLEQEPSLLLVLDEVADPQNLGSLVRVAEVAGAGAVMVTERRSAPLSPAFRRASVGASELVPIVTVGNLQRDLEKLKQHGYWIVGTSLEGSSSLFEFEFPEKTALILGSEGEGMRRLTAELCDYLIQLPMFGKIDSLNVAQAGAVFLFEYRRQISLRLKTGRCDE
jgi:23S rRNA (guanosine2251-2'-O)-methyltransferase